MVFDWTKFLTLLTSCIDPVWICDTCNCKNIGCKKETSWNNGEFIHFHTSVSELHEFRSVIFRCLGLSEIDVTFTSSFQREPHEETLSSSQQYLEDNIWGLWCKQQQYGIRHWTSSHYEALSLTYSTDNSPYFNITVWKIPSIPRLHPCWIFLLDLRYGYHWKGKDSTTKTLFSRQYRVRW